MLEAIAAANIHSPLPGEALDIGSGNGELIGAARARFGFRTSACDYSDTLIKDPTQRVDILDLSADKLPYLDGRFLWLPVSKRSRASNKFVRYFVKSFACSSQAVLP